MSLVSASSPAFGGLSVPRKWLTLPSLVLLVGAAALVIPTMIDVARVNWSTDQGGHGPIVLATGIWLLWRETRSGLAPGGNRAVLPAAIALAGFLLFFVVSRITNILEFEAFAMYGALVSAAFMFWSGKSIRALWFPILYLAFSLPPPDSVVAAVTQPIKILISQAAVNLLYLLGYPIASSGVTIQIAQFELLVAAACAGLNSIISLSAICLLYAYLRRRSNAAYLFVLMLAILPVAVFANFIRVLTLILITYYGGEAAAQGFLHDFAGLLMFSVALFTIFAFDEMVSPLFNRRHESSAS